MSRVSSSAESRTVPWTQLYWGLGTTTLATLILELSLTRIFSVVFYYHFAFLAISVALFGLGAGGVFSYVVTGWKGDFYDKLGKLAIANSAAVFAALSFVLSRTGDLSNTTLALVYVAAALPFVLAGAVVSLAISEAVERIDRAYFFDLAGAAAGCLLLIPFLSAFGGPNTVLSAAVLYSIAAGIWFHQAQAHRARAIAALVALGLTTLMIANGKAHWIDIRSAKGETLPPEKLTAWNSFSRIGVTGSSQSGWLVRIDADASTGIAPYDWSVGIPETERWKLLHQGPGFPYAIKPGAKALVIGPGGGYDVSRALASGSKDITGVEINPIIANTVMRGAMRSENHDLYFRPEVHIVVEDGRSFIRRTPDKYQVIQATLVDTWASTSAGAFALSENNLYTADAFYDYLTRLTDDGVLAFTRWGFDQPRESLRLLTLGMDALGRLGEKDFANHFLAVREDTAKLQGWGALDTILIARKAFSAEDVARARQVAADAKMEVLYAPGTPATNAFGQLLTAPNADAFLQRYQYDVRSLDDDRPFFFYTVQPRDLLDYFLHAKTDSADYKINKAVPLLFGLIGISLLATLLVLFLPRLVLGHRLPKETGVQTFLLYFLCLGAGYILIQVALIQKFVLLLGQPTYALTAIVFSMLVASGLGSYYSRSVAGEDGSRLPLVLFGVNALVAALAYTSKPMITAAATWPLPAKLLLIVGSIAPAAFLMGVPFPTGLRALEQWHSPSVRWAWSMNAAASVLGSAGAIFLAIYLGLRMTLMTGGLLYLVALAVIAMTAGARARSVHASSDRG